MNVLRRLLGIERGADKAPAIEEAERRSNATLARARRAERVAERDRLAAALGRTVSAVRQEPR